MLKETVTFTNPFTDEQVTRDLYFNLSRAEIIELITEHEQYIEQMKNLNKDSSSVKEILEPMKFFIRFSYGERDGDNFIKNERQTEAFMASEAYSEFLFGLFTPEKAAAFVNGILPAEMIEQALQDGSLEGNPVLEDVARLHATDRPATARPATARPATSDHLPKQVKTVELPREDAKPYFDTEATRQSRLEELGKRPASEVSLDELIALRQAQENQ